MKKEEKNLQGRREFFKDAAKKALPILGAVALMSSPMVAKAVENGSFSSGSSLCESCTGLCTGCTGCTASCGGCTGCTGCTGCDINCSGSSTKRI